MRKIGKKALSVVIMVGVFLLGFYVGTKEIGNNSQARASTQDDSSGAEARASLETTSYMHHLPIVITSGRSLSLEFPSEFQLQNRNNERYLFEEADERSRITRISILFNKDKLFDRAIKSGDCVIRVEYDHSGRGQ